ncbi:MAG TPA: DUF4835 family protein [Rhodothermales bacterium]|nr:DUF4835 family protein [Rhodothermales bacterium]
MLKFTIPPRLGAVLGLATLLACFLAAPPVLAQEFDCQAHINYEQLQGNDFTFLDQLDDRIMEYVNNNVWTRDQFEDVERIDCTINVTLDKALSLTSFSGRIIVAMWRPIYGTAQFTTVVQFTDPNLQFNYTQGSPLVFDLEHYDPLTSVIDFYAYVMLGYDYDTFDAFGGTRYFETARRIAERAQSVGAQGWLEIGSDQGRLNLVSQLLDARYKPLRQAYFDYHYGGLDHFLIETDAARLRVYNVVESLNTLVHNLARSYSTDLFFATKYTELRAIFQDSQIQNQAYAMLTEVDPAHMSEYNKLTQ